MTKVCSKCGVIKPSNSFSKWSRRCENCKAEYRKANRDRIRERSHNWYVANRERTKARNRTWKELNVDRIRETHRTWRAINKEKERDYSRRTKYGTDGKALFSAQGGKCAICAKKIDLSAHLDHCSKTKVVRGFLCKDCNPALGKFNHDPVCLRKAAEYLERTVIFE